MKENTKNKNINIREVLKKNIDCHIVDNKRYLLTEKKMSKKEMVAKKMCPRLDKETINKMHDKKTHLGRELKEGDILLYAFLLKSNDVTDGFLLETGDDGEIGNVVINFTVISLTEDEIDKYILSSDNFQQDENRLVIPTLELLK